MANPTRPVRAHRIRAGLLRWILALLRPLAPTSIATPAQHTAAGGEQDQDAEPATPTGRARGPPPGAAVADTRRRPRAPIHTEQRKEEPHPQSDGPAAFTRADTKDTPKGTAKHEP